MPLALINEPFGWLWISLGFLTGVGLGLGFQREGFMGGYGYCMGPAIWGNYVVAGALVQGRTAGGVLNVYKLG